MEGLVQRCVVVTKLCDILYTSLFPSVCYNIMRLLIVLGSSVYLFVLGCSVYVLFCVIIPAIDCSNISKSALSCQL